MSIQKERVQKLAAALENGEGALISSNPNRLYFTSFESSAGSLLITPQKSFFLIDFRYFEKAKSVVDSCEVVLADKPMQQIAGLLESLKIDRLYLETSFVSMNNFKIYSERFTGVRLSDDPKIDRMIEQMRSIKSPEEVSLMRRAQQLTDSTFNHILNFLRPGVSEREVMLEMEFFMRLQGSEGAAFDFIVVSGKNSSLPHGVPTEKLLESGDFVTMDFGGVIGGYRSDMTRTVVLGEPSEKQRTVYDTVLKAQQAALSFIAPGVRCCDVDRVARDIIEKAGYGANFGHGLGHSVGIEIHENPACNRICETVMQPGVIMTVEPGIYIENEFGVRIEDMVLVTNDGIENLTKSPKELIVI